jgi:hypothetical protein
MLSVYPSGVPSSQPFLPRRDRYRLQPREVNEMRMFAAQRLTVSLSRLVDSRGRFD